MDFQNINKIDDLIARLKKNPRLRSFDEAATKQAIILPLLKILGWDTYDVEEVYPEYTVEKRRVDYALRIQGRNEFFLEVKKPVEELENHEEQLLDYSFRQGVKLASLTNGITWLFYLPLKEGSWADRKFYAVDIIAQEPEHAVKKFVEILSRQNVECGEAHRSAESIYNSAIRQRTLKEKLPEAWNKIINEPSPILIDSLADITEKLCGFKPTNIDVIEFLESRQIDIILRTKVPSKSPIIEPKKRISPKESFPIDIAVHLTVSPEDALNELKSVRHQTFLKALDNYWHVEVPNRVKAQSVCWLFCWAKTGMKSKGAAIASKQVFNKILDIRYERFDKLVGLEWARDNRKKPGNIESKLAKLL